MPAFGATLLLFSAVLVLSVALEIAAMGLGPLAAVFIVAAVGVAAVAGACIYVLAGARDTFEIERERIRR